MRGLGLMGAVLQPLMGADPVLDIIECEIPAVKVLKPKKFDDQRGFFSETYNKSVLAEQGIDLDFVQDNHSLSREKGVVRGLHFQVPPFAQAKLLRVVRGAIFDVAVDLRGGSATFGQHVARVISAEAWDQILIPVGFAHGFCTCEPDTEVIYKVTGFYAPEHDKGILWSDPDLKIDWPVAQAEAIVSEKDRTHPRLRDMVPNLQF